MSNATRVTLGCIVIALATVGFFGAKRGSPVATIKSDNAVVRPNTVAPARPPVSLPAGATTNVPRFDESAMLRINDPEAAQAYFRGLSSAEKLHALGRIIDVLYPTNPNKFLLMAALFRVWTEDDLPSAIAATGEYDTAKTALVQEWARIDLRAAWTWVDSLNRGDASAFRYYIVEAGVDAGHENIITDLFAEKLQSSGGVSELPYFAARWFDKDPTGAWRWLGRVEAINPRAAASAGSSLATKLANLPTTELTTLLQGHGDLMLTAIVGPMVQAWVSSDRLDRVTEFAAAAPQISADYQILIAGSIGLSVVRDEPDLALKIFASVPDAEQRDKFIVDSVGRLAGDGPKRSEIALSYALAIENETRRVEMLKTAYRLFFESYPEEAQAAISRDGFPKNLRAQLEQVTDP